LLTFNLSSLAMRFYLRINNIQRSHQKLAPLPCTPTSRAQTTLTLLIAPTLKSQRFSPRPNSRYQQFAPKSNSNHSPRSSSSHPAQNQHFKNFNFHQESKPARKLSKSARKLSLTHRSTFCSSFPIHATPTQDSNSKYESCAAQLYPKAVDKKTTLIQSPSPKLES
jgi:hypothetical protein